MCSYYTPMSMLVWSMATSLALGHDNLASGQDKPAPEQAVHQVGKDGLTIDGKLSKADPPLASLGKVPHQVFLVKLEAGQPYVLTLRSDDFDAFLIVEDAKGKKLSEDDDSGGLLDARLGFQPKANGVYRILTASLNRLLGDFKLHVQPRELTREEKLLFEANQFYAQQKNTQALDRVSASPGHSRKAVSAGTIPRRPPRGLDLLVWRQKCIGPFGPIQ